VTTRRLALLALLVVLGIFAYVQWQAILAARESARMESFKALTRHVAQHGAPGTLPAEALELFELPTDGQRDVPFLGVTETQDGSSKTLTVRKRGEITDVLLGDVEGSQGQFYHASEYGKLLRSIRLGPTPQVAADDRESFTKEVAFWLYWWEDRRKEK
jgi:hypothetical protein